VFLSCQDIAVRITASKFNIKIKVKNPNKSKSESGEYLNYPLFIVQPKGFRSNKLWKEKLVLAENVPFSRPKLVLP
jgi:hypothetical protein